MVGVPGTNAAGEPRISAGLARPLILATLERSDAMRVLAEGNPLRPVLLAASFIAGLVLVAVGLAWTLVDALL